MRFSVIIPVRAINTFLKENIEHLKKLDYEDFEVLILPDVQEHYDFDNDTRFKIIATGSVGPGEKRNIGAKFATGEILAFLDDDAYPSKDWLKQANGVFFENEIYALGGPAVTPLDADVLEKISGALLQSPLTSGGTAFRHVPSKSRFIDDYPTVNLLVKKQAFDAVGGFPLSFWPGEDTKLCLDLVKKYGNKFIYDPRPLVFHHRRRGLLPHLKQISRYGRHRGHFAKIFPENSRVLSYFIPSLFVLGLTFGPVTYLFSKILFAIYIVVLCFYTTMLVFEALRLCEKTKGFYQFVLSVVTIPVGIFLTHVVYGVNFMLGYLLRPKLVLRDIDKKTGNFLGG